VAGLVAGLVRGLVAGLVGGGCVAKRRYGEGEGWEKK
jgi:hypothetical protein